MRYSATTSRQPIARIRGALLVSSLFYQRVLTAVCGPVVAVVMGFALPGCSKPADSPAASGQTGVPPSNTTSTASATIGSQRRAELGPLKIVTCMKFLGGLD